VDLKAGLQLKIPKISKSTITHYAAIAKAENVTIELSLDGFTLRLSPTGNATDEALDRELGEFERRHTR
jgi:hypothetical protein